MFGTVPQTLRVLAFPTLLGVVCHRQTNDNAVICNMAQLTFSTNVIQLSVWNTAFSCHLPGNDVDTHNTEIAGLRPRHMWKELMTAVKR